ITDSGYFTKSINFTEAKPLFYSLFTNILHDESNQAVLQSGGIAVSTGSIFYGKKQKQGGASCDKCGVCSCLQVL
ncbi:hypothetical protein ABEV35_14935, partial [Geobacillus stearothermophilus]